MDKTLHESIKKIVKYNAKLEDEYRKLASIANDLFTRSPIGDRLDGEITCEYNNSDGIVFVIETENDTFPHVVRVSDFFDIFWEANLPYITYYDFQSISF